MALALHPLFRGSIMRKFLSICFFLFLFFCFFLKNAISEVELLNYMVIICWFFLRTVIHSSYSILYSNSLLWQTFWTFVTIHIHIHACIYIHIFFIRKIMNNFSSTEKKIIDSGFTSTEWPVCFPSIGRYESCIFVSLAFIS